MKKFDEIDFEKLSYSKQLEMKWYPKIKWIYVKFYSIYGYYWAYKLFNKNYSLPYWEQWTLWIFAMLSLYFFARDERLDNFFDNVRNK
ncbi:hypothetical protein D3C72_2220380 [compost metagenome]